MTYKNTLQGRFVATGFPAAAMLFVSLLLWGVGCFFSVGSSSTILNSLGLNFIGDVGARLFSLLAYACVALVLGNLYLFERRVSFLPHIFLWLTAVLLFLQPDYLIALSLLFFVISVAQLFSCSRESEPHRGVCVAFAILSFSSLFLLQFAYLIPLFFFYLWLSNILVWRTFFAALIGFVTPLWLLFGVLFVFPSLDGFLIPLRLGLLNAAAPATVVFSVQSWAILAMELLVMLVAVAQFFISSLPAKPLLRHRLLFVIVVNVFLLLLSFVQPQDYSLLLAWRLPGLAIMASYIFSGRITRLSNIYFILLNIMWLVIAAMCLWII